MLTLKDLTKQLLEAEEKWEQARIKLLPLEVEYQSRLDQLQLQSQRGSIIDRQAEAREIIRQEPIAQKYGETALEAKLAYMRLDTLKVASSNIRSIAWEEVK